MSKLKSLRETKNLTQTEIAAKVGIALMTYIRYENPKYNREPDVSIALKIAKVLDTTVENLWGTNQKEK